ncbi:MAG: hypothetical protein ACJAY8_001069, partial [Sphingobacteriales bacterium]
MTNSIIKRTFNTPIGKVVCELISSSSDIEEIGAKEYDNGSSISYKIGGFRIELIEFKIKLPL